MSRLFKAAALLVFVAAASGLAFYLYSRSRVSSLKREAERKLDGIHVVRATRPVTRSLIRERVVDRMNKLGLEVSGDRVEVTFEKVTEENRGELPDHVEAGVAIAEKLPRHEVEVWIMRISFPLVVSYGLASSTFRIEKTAAVKGDVEPHETAE
jgi:hypothetical protein